MLLGFDQNQIGDLNRILDRDPLLKALSNGMSVREVAPGYYVAPLNMHIVLKPFILKTYADDLPGNISSYGVVDTPEQFIELFGPTLALPKDRVYGVFFTEFRKEDQDPNGGWRWHKWGEYYGTKEPQHEYLYDEGPDIESVFSFHIFEMNAAALLGV